MALIIISCEVPQPCAPALVVRGAGTAEGQAGRQAGGRAVPIHRVSWQHVERLARTCRGRCSTPPYPTEAVPWPRGTPSAPPMRSRLLVCSRSRQGQCEGGAKQEHHCVHRCARVLGPLSLGCRLMQAKCSAVQVVESKEPTTVPGSWENDPQGFLNARWHNNARARSRWSMWSQMAAAGPPRTLLPAACPATAGAPWGRHLRAGRIGRAASSSGARPRPAAAAAPRPQQYGPAQARCASATMADVVVTFEVGWHAGSKRVAAPVLVGRRPVMITL